MAELLSAQEKAEILAVLKDVTDTFYQDTCTLHKHTQARDRWGEGGQNTVTDHTLDCLGTVPKNNQVTGETSGGVDLSLVEIRFDMQYLDAQNLVAGGNADVKPWVDEVTFQGSRFHVEGLHYDDTDFMGTKVLAVLRCRKIEKRA